MKWLARWVALISGCTSLVAEVLWVRIVGFAESGRAEVFSIVLGLYLFGIAVGAYFGRRLCFRNEEKIVLGLFFLLLGSAAFDPISIIIYSGASQEIGGYLSALPWIIGTASLKGAVFPIVHHLGSNDQTRLKGLSFSNVYLFNLIGCTIGPALLALLTLDYLTTRDHFAIISFLSAASACVVAWKAGTSRLTTAAMVIAVIPLIWYMPDPLRAIAGTTTHKDIHFWLENKEGIIHTVESDEPGGHTVYGGNVYDGRVNIDLRINSNKIDRVHALMLAHPKPKTALVIGVSSGSWARVMLGHPTVTSMDAIEINPGYKKMIDFYSPVRPILSDPRLNLVFDDGRRWMKQNPNRLYDVIATNSTFHWRSGATNLLSREFLQELKQHLNPGGIALLNTTGSIDVMKTATTVFRHVYLYRNNILMSDTDFRETLSKSADRMFNVKLSPGVDLDPESEEDRIVADNVSSYPILSLDLAEIQAGRTGEIVTDFNMLTEYRNSQKQ